MWDSRYLLAIVSLLLCGQIATSAASNVLLCAAGGSKSHARPLLQFGMELVKRGHTVRFAGVEEYLPWAREFAPSIEGISLGPDAFPVEKRVKFMTYLTSDFRLLDSVEACNEYFAEYYVPYYTSLNQTFSAPDASKPDIMVADFMAFPCFDWAYMNNVTRVVVAPVISTLFPNFGWNWPFPTSHYSRRTWTLWDQIVNLVYWPIWAAPKLIRRIAAMDELRAQVGVPPIRTWVGRTANVPTILTTFFGFERMRPLPPLARITGPLIPTEYPPLDGPVAAHLAKAKAANESVVFVSLGSEVFLMPKHIEAIYDGLKCSGKYAVWTLGLSKEGNPPPSTEKILVIDWVSQMALLEDPSVSVFVAHGGAGGIHEGTFFGKPMVVVPFFADQPENAAQIDESGAGIILRPDRMTAQSFCDAINTVGAPNSTYARHARRLSMIARVRARHAVEEAAEFIELVDVAGYEHLITLNYIKPWYVAYNIDVYAFAVVLAFAIVLFFRWVGSLCCGARGARKVKKE
eukprot:CAMPEP_0196658866 /NCGR_PEP_ID=MMETSP1086-20130531/32022_1 /TAXON_ID=77921 /ORGANISM="Cyanoptyche  gloeocystis , Strain SAG4.97" /LENGTH=516 /DNA_ID=CAMNT_0041992639 /DNA_START=40 /DNA_END=1590 /DNA_ORIENTATION=+